MQPIDLIYLVVDDLVSEVTELETRIDYAYRTEKKQADSTWDHTGEVTIRVMDRTGFDPDDVTIFELLPLLKNLRDFITGCRPLAADDYLLPSEETTDPQANPNPKGHDLDELMSRINELQAAFETTVAELGARLPADALDDDPATAPNLDAIDFDGLRTALIALAHYRVDNAFPLDAVSTTTDRLHSLLTQAVNAFRQGEAQGVAALNRINFDGADANDLSVEEKINFLREAAQLLLGSAFNLIPVFAYKNIDEINAAIAFRDAPLDHSLIRFANNPLIVDEWLQGVARVRPKVESLEAICTYHEVFKDSELILKPLQLLFRASDHWVAVEFPAIDPDDLDNPATFKPEGDFLAMVQQIPTGYNSRGSQSGLVIDEWDEIIPGKVETTGIAVHYNQPNTEPAQTILLAISSELTGQWTWDDLVATLHETLDRAKKRAAEPELLSATPFAHVLPAILSSVSSFPLATISTDLIYQTQSATMSPSNPDRDP